MSHQPASTPRVEIPSELKNFIDNAGHTPESIIGSTVIVTNEKIGTLMLIKVDCIVYRPGEVALMLSLDHESPILNIREFSGSKRFNCTFMDDDSTLCGLTFF